MDVSIPLPDTRQAAISLVTQGIRGDVDAVKFTLDMCDVGEFVALLHSSLSLLRALALRLRSAEGLMACDVWLSEISRDEHRSRDTRLAAALIVGHSMTCRPPTETVTVAETYGEMFNVGAAVFNQAAREADYRIPQVFCAAIELWHGCCRNSSPRRVLAW